MDSNDTQITMIQGDDAPPKTWTFIREDGTIGDLTNASAVNFNIIRPDTNVQTNTGNTTCAIQSPKTNGQAIYTWNSTDLPVTGIYRCTLRITYSDSTIETAIVYISVESNTT